MCCECQELAGDVSRLLDDVSSLERDMAAFRKGHPILFIQEPSDIADFDVATGLGFDNWAGWGIANGNVYTASNGDAIQTQDLRDKFIVGSGTTYAVNDVGGEATHTLTIPELPVVTPVVTNPAHTHAVTDPTHTHGITDPQHTHVTTAPAHTHTVTLTGGDHYHPIRVRYRIITDDAGGTEFNALEASQVEDTDNTLYTGTPAQTTDGDHTHTGTTDSTAPTISSAVASTGISAVAAATGISIASTATAVTVDPFGSGDAHNNLPPYIAGMFVQRIG